MLKEFFKKLFCKHKYIFQGSMPCTCIEEHDSEPTKCPIHFYICEKCGKRLIVRSPENYKYTDTILQEIKLWKKGQLEIDFKEIKRKNK